MKLLPDQKIRDESPRYSLGVQYETLSSGVFSCFPHFAFWLQLCSHRVHLHLLEETELLGKIFADDPATGPNEGIEIKIVNSNTGSISIKVPFEVTNPTPHGVEPYIQITYEEDQGGNNGFQPISGVTPWTAGIDVGAGTTTSPTVKGFTPTLFEVNPLLISLQHLQSHRKTILRQLDQYNCHN